MTAMDNVDDTLNKSDVPLTLQNLHNFIQFNKVTPSHTEDETLKTLNSMVGHRRSFYIYDVDKRLLYTTAKTAMDFQNKPNNKIVEINGKTPGYIVERKIISQETGEPIGYIQAFYDISFYYNINRRLMLTLTILEIVVLILSQIIGFYMVARFMTPLEKLHKAMKKSGNIP